MLRARHLDAFRGAVDAFAASVTSAGLDAPVPTTPDWDLGRLLAHQGRIHRWTAGLLLGVQADPGAAELAGVAAADPVAWLRAGAARLATTLAEAPADLQAPVFLADAPAPREFWARRQCHETTLHAVDALSAVLGRYPRSDDTWIETDVALDGIDELLTGFLPRPQSTLRTDEPTTIAVLPDDADQRWLVAVSPQAPVTARGLGDEDADVVLRGPAVALYLTLWNRSDEVSAEGLDLWAEQAQVTRG